VRNAESRIAARIDRHFATGRARIRRAGAEKLSSLAPKPPIEFEQMRELVHELFRKNIEEHSARTGRGVIGSHITSSSFKPDGDGRASMSTSKGQTLVTFDLRIFRGHRLQIEERLRMADDNKLLLYTQAITGPNGKVGRYEVAFDVTQGIPPATQR
jgi:hypothetical protein